MNVEELVINLKVISSLGVNQKLITKEVILNIEPLSIFPEFARRWLRQDNREETIKKITYIVDESIKYASQQYEREKKESKKIEFHDCVYDNSNDSDDMSTLSVKRESDENINILRYLILSKKGLENLKKTYSPCIKTVAKIDWIIDKINDSEKLYKIN